MPLMVDKECLATTVRAKGRIGRPPKVKPWKQRHPAVLFPALLRELNVAGEFINGILDKTLQEGTDWDEQDKLMALQQMSSRIDEMHLLLHNLKNAVAYTHPNPYRIIGCNPGFHDKT